MTSDTQLLDGWANGDEACGRMLVERYYGALLRFFRAKVASGADDLVQDTFLALVKSRDQFRADASFRSFLFGTARNKLRMHYRQRRRKDDRVDFGSHSVIDLGASPSGVLAHQTEKRLLLEGLRRIAVDDQILIELYYWEKLTGPELADVLDLGEPAVRSRLHRAKKRLADALHTIAESPGLLQSTLDDIEAWARRAGELADRERIERDRQRPVSHDDS